VEDFARLESADLLVQLAKWRRADVSRHAAGDLARALRRITARTAVAAFSHDNWFPWADCRAEQDLISDSSFGVIESLWGHYAWGIAAAETAQIERTVSALLTT
jgi:homoserine O-acetyltransferase